MIDVGSVRAVLRQDLLDVRRARLVQGVLTMYVLFVGLVFLGVSLSPDPSVSGAIQLTSLLGFLFIPLVALLAGYLAIAGERESGTIRFLVGYPVLRSEVLLGKFLSRFGLVTGAIGVAFLGAGAIATVLYADPVLLTVAVFGVLTALFAGSYVGMAVGVSAATGSRSRAMSTIVSLYFVFTLLWSHILPVTLPKLIAGAASGLLGVQLSGPVWNVFANLSPAMAYFWSLQLLPVQAFEMQQVPVGPVTVLCILIAWIVVPPALGYLSFARADIE